MHLEVFKGESDLWSVRLVSSNDKTLMISETYDSKTNAERAAFHLQYQMEDRSASVPVEIIDDEN